MCCGPCPFIRTTLMASEVTQVGIISSTTYRSSHNGPGFVTARGRRANHCGINHATINILTLQNASLSSKRCTRMAVSKHLCSLHSRYACKEK